MLETGVRQFRLAMGMVWGRRLSPRNVARLVDDALDTIAEFGQPGPEALEVLGGPLADPQEKLEWANHGLRRTARRLAATSPFYARRFEAAQADPEALDLAAMRAIPVTTKHELIEHAADFRCSDVPGYLATRTTGTTGRPAEVWLSRYEMELWPALGALGSVLRGDLRPGDDHAGQRQLPGHRGQRTWPPPRAAWPARCAGCSASCRPDESLDSLSQGGTTLLLTCPSYLAELVSLARRRGLGPGDFRLRRVTVGGEVLSPSLAQAACQTFGVAADRGHLQHDRGHPGHRPHVQPAAPAPRRQQRPDRAARPADGRARPGLARWAPSWSPRTSRTVTACRFSGSTPATWPAACPNRALDCELAGIPATSQVLGKADHLLRLSPDEVVTPRQLIEAIEALPSAPWPARYRVGLIDGRIRLTLPAAAIAGYGEAAARRHFADAGGLDADLAIVGDDQATALRQTRSDLRETTFASQHALVGA